MEYLEENNNNDNNDNNDNDNDNDTQRIRIFALYIFSIITIITIILFFINNKFYDKLYLLVCIIIQLFSLVSLYFDYTYFLNLLDKFFAILIGIGVLFITTKNVLLTILSVLFITLITRIYFDKCMFFYYEKYYENYCDNKQVNYYTDIIIFLAILVNLYKIVYLK